MKQPGANWRRNKESVFVLRKFQSFLLQNVPDQEFVWLYRGEGCWQTNCRQIEQRLKQARSFLRPSSMVGPRRDQKILRQDSSNAGKFIAGKTATIPARRLLKSDKLSSEANVAEPLA